MKFGLFALMLVASWLMYENRGFVTDAYATSDTDIDIRLDGIDLGVETTPLPPSPFVTKRGEDTRRRPLDLAYVTASPEAEQPVVAMDGGTSTLSGSASYNSRPAAGALIYIERHTANGVGSTTVTANAEGRWNLAKLPGGRYRLRSWLPGQAVDPASSVLFLEAGATNTHGFQLQRIDERPTVRINHSGEMFRGLTGSVGVTVGRRQVDDQGRVVTESLAGARVTLGVSGAAQLETPSTVTVGGSGHVTFTLRCTHVGAVNMVASVEIPPDPQAAVSRAAVSQDEDARTTTLPAPTVIRVGDNHPGCKPIPTVQAPPATAAPANNASRGTSRQRATTPTSTRATTRSTAPRRATTTTVRAQPTTVAPRSTAAGRANGGADG